jgi:hypothetical protein
LRPRIRAAIAKLRLHQFGRALSCSMKIAAVGELIRSVIRLGIVVAIPALTLYLVNLLD